MFQILTRNSAGSGACCRRAPQATHAHPAQTNVCLPLLLSMLLASSSLASAAIDLVHHSLRLRGCDLDATDFKGRSPLAIACMAGNSPSPSLLPPLHSIVHSLLPFSDHISRFYFPTHQQSHPYLYPSSSSTPLKRPCTNRTTPPSLRSICF